MAKAEQTRLRTWRLTLLERAAEGSRTVITVGGCGA